MWSLCYIFNPSISHQHISTTWRNCFKSLNRNSSNSLKQKTNFKYFLYSQNPPKGFLYAIKINITLMVGLCHIVETSLDCIPWNQTTWPRIFVFIQKRSPSRKRIRKCVTIRSHTISERLCPSQKLSTYTPPSTQYNLRRTSPS